MDCSNIVLLYICWQFQLMTQLNRDLESNMSHVWKRIPTFFNNKFNFVDSLIWSQPSNKSLYEQVKEKKMCTGTHISHISHYAFKEILFKMSKFLLFFNLFFQDSSNFLPIFPNCENFQFYLPHVLQMGQIFTCTSVLLNWNHFMWVEVHNFACKKFRNVEKFLKCSEFLRNFWRNFKNCDKVCLNCSKIF